MGGGKTPCLLSSFTQQRDKFQIIKLKDFSATLSHPSQMEAEISCVPNP
jgi:hypothetical protein